MSSDVALKLGRADHGRRVTQAEFADAVYDEPWRYERVAGWLQVMSPSGDQHAESLDELIYALVEYRRQHREIVRTVRCEAWIRIDDETDRIADFAVFLNGPRVELSTPERVPEIVYEIVSRGSKRQDDIDKRAEYGRVGVLEYVIVDRKRRQVTVLRQTPDGTYSEETLGPDDVYQSPLLPGFALSLEAAFDPPK